MVCTAWTSPKPHSTQFGFSFGWFTERAGKTAGNMEQEESAAVVSSPSTTECETLVSEPDLKSSSVAEDDGGEKPIGESKPTLLDQDDIFRAIEVVERDSVALAESFTSLYDSLRLSLSEATSSSVDHMNCFGDAAGQIQERALDAASKGNRYINSCRRLNEEMKHIDGLAKQLKILRRNVDALDSAANRQLYLP